MMTKINLLAIGSALLTSGIRAIPIPVMKVYMDLGPYEKYQNNPTVTYQIISTYTVSKTVYEIIRFGDENNPNQKTIIKANHTIAAKGTYEGYFTLPTKTFLGDNGMTVTFDIFDEDGSKLRSNSVVVSPIKSETINPTTYQEMTYRCPITRVGLKNLVTYSLNETYTFSNVEDYFVSDIYYRLDISQFDIQTSLSEEEFSYESAYLIISGNETYFPSLSYRDGMAKIPLQVVYNSSRLYFKFLNTLYVESRLLMMSTTPKNNYKATTHFYLPVNHADDLMGSEFTFEINEMGFNKTTLRWSSTLISENPIIGHCQNSGYCVIGKVSK